MYSKTQWIWLIAQFTSPRINSGNAYSWVYHWVIESMNTYPSNTCKVILRYDVESLDLHVAITQYFSSRWVHFIHFSRSGKAILLNLDSRKEVRVPLRDYWILFSVRSAQISIDREAHVFDMSAWAHAR